MNTCQSSAERVTPVAQMKVWERNMAPLRTPEDSPRLFDMVRVVDESVRPAFYFALRDTLVAQDMEQATRMAFQRDKRWRVVTLKGQIIEMAGGGRAFLPFIFTRLMALSRVFNACIYLRVGLFVFLLCALQEP